MALLRTNSKIVERVLIDLYFDDESEKHFEVGEKDIIKVRYNDAGYAREIVGKVDRIDGNRNVIPPHYHGQGPHRPPIISDKAGYMVVDGSEQYYGKTSKIFFKDILDLDMIEKYDEDFIVKTTSDGPVTKIRMVDGVLQVFTGGCFVNIDTLLSKETKELLESLKNNSSSTDPETPPQEETTDSNTDETVTS